MYWHKKQQQILKGILHAYFCCLTKKKRSFFSNGFHFFKVFSVACRIKKLQLSSVLENVCFSNPNIFVFTAILYFFWVKHFTFFLQLRFLLPAQQQQKNVWHFNPRKKKQPTQIPHLFSSWIFCMDFQFVFFSLVLFRIEGMLSSWFGCFICHFFRMVLLFFAVGKDYVECSILGIGKQVGLEQWRFSKELAISQ